MWALSYHSYLICWYIPGLSFICSISYYLQQTTQSWLLQWKADIFFHLPLEASYSLIHQVFLPIWPFYLFSVFFKELPLTHFMPLVSVDTPWKHQKTSGFSDIFRGYRERLVAWNGLNTPPILRLDLVAKKDDEWQRFFFNYICNRSHIWFFFLCH